MIRVLTVVFMDDMVELADGFSNDGCMDWMINSRPTLHHHLDDAVRTATKEVIERVHEDNHGQTSDKWLYVDMKTDTRPELGTAVHLVWTRRGSDLVYAKACINVQFVKGQL